MNRKLDIQRFFAGLMIVAMAVCLSCASKRKTRSKKVETVSVKKENDIKVTVDSNFHRQLSKQKLIDIIASGTINDSGESNAINIDLLAENPEDSSYVKITDKGISFQNAKLHFSHTNTKRDRRQETKIKASRKDTVSSNIKSEINRTKTDKGNVELDVGEKQRNSIKEKSGGLPFWAWVGLIVVALAVAYIYRKIKNKILS